MAFHRLNGTSGLMLACIIRLSATAGGTPSLVEFNSHIVAHMTHREEYDIFHNILYNKASDKLLYAKV